MLAAKLTRTQAERRAEAERRILEAAIRLLVERGYDRFSMQEVGELAGYSRGLPAHYFGKKDDLLSEVAMFIIARYYETVASTDAYEPGLPRLVARIGHYVQGLGTPGNRALNVLIAEARFHAQLKRTITELNRRARMRWQAEVLAGIEAGNIRADADADAVGAMVHAFVRGQSTFVDMDPGYDVGAATESLVQMLQKDLPPQTNGIAPRHPAR
jgi:TetR/AcrR family acrAB operon transcriptional repressor